MDFTRFLVSAQTTNRVPSCRRARTQTRPSDAAGIIYGHQHDFRWEHRPWISMWPSVVAQVTDISADLGTLRPQP